MKIINLPLATDTHQTNATFTGYLKQPDERAGHLTYPAIIFVPGGSYTHIPEAQAESIALAFSANGYQSFILRYSFVGEQTPLMPHPLIELGQTIATIRTHAAEWQINPNAIIVMGVSVGGHIVSLYNDYWDAPWLADATQQPSEQLKPTATVLGYPVISPLLGFPHDDQTISSWTDDANLFAAEQHVTPTNVPTFIWGTVDDSMVPSINALSYANALASQQIPQEIHLFAHGPHGIALADDRTAWNNESNNPHVAHWFKLCLEWLKQFNTL